MLHEQTRRGDVVAIDDGAVAADVDLPPDVVAEVSVDAVLRVEEVAVGVEALDAVVGPPHPGVVDQDVVAIDLQRDVGLADIGAADAEIDVAECRRVVPVAVPVVVIIIVIVVIVPALIAIILVVIAPAPVIIVIIIVVIVPPADLQQHR